ncbi:MAG TPA: DNA polymerase IV [Acidimicrobiales bacterium]|nr:DNA polymerase IV [Acidimicrobiales bacterium]
MVDEPAVRTILHVDMDAFYASVEVVDDPDLSGKPVVVGGTGPRGVVASCSYEARAYGVRSAMPSSQARRLCPQAVFLAGRFDRYAEVSRQIHAVFERYTPVVEGISLDEAFLDVTGSLRLFGSVSDIAAGIRAEIRSGLGLGCSVGVAPVKFLAKLASEAAKPKASLRGVVAGPGVVVIEPGDELHFLHPLPIEALWGVGPATATRLRRLGVTTVGELALVPIAVLEKALGRANGAHLARLARGLDDRPVQPDREVKSVSHEETYPVDRYEPGELHVEVVRMADSVASRMRRAGLVGRTVTLKVRYGDFSTRTRSRTSPALLAEGTAIASLASELLREVDVSAGVRLLGVGVSNLSQVEAGSAEQMSLDLDSAAPAEPSDRPRPARGGREEAAAAVEAVRDRFGSAAVGPAVLLDSGRIRVKRPGDTQWGPQAAI